MIYNNPNDCMGNRPIWEKFGVALGILANPWMLFLDKLGLVKDPLYITRSAEGQRSMRFTSRGRTTDINDAVVVLSGKEYPPELTGLSELSNADSHPVVLDCGGHIGTFAMYIKSRWPSSSITVMEPVPANLELLKKNIQENKLDNITVIPYAIYGQSGRFYIDLSGKQFDAVSVTTTKPAHENFVTIDALTLNEIIARQNLTKIDLMKLDVEGAEYNIFANSLPALQQYVKRIIMEFHPAGDKDKRDEIVGRLCGNNGGFRLIYETKNILGFENEAI